MFLNKLYLHDLTTIAWIQLLQEPRRVFSSKEALPSVCKVKAISVIKAVVSAALWCGPGSPSWCGCADGIRPWSPVR